MVLPSSPQAANAPFLDQLPILGMNQFQDFNPLKFLLRVSVNFRKPLVRKNNPSIQVDINPRERILHQAAVIFFGLCQPFFRPLSLENFALQGPVGFAQLRRALLNAGFQLIVGPAQLFFAILEVPEKKGVWSDEPRFDERFVDQVIRDHLEIMADQVGKVVDPEVKCKGEFGKSR
ncbi:MAG: hypothetical protein H6Q42_1477 [Deltaproteobacteria bacterium]|nr:hypothetical protein [Deltaproteobacteria bacterium]